MTILGDWGTTRLRLFRLEGGAVVDRLVGPGIGQITSSPAATFAATIAPWQAAARGGGVLLCGMAGSRNGVVEAPYASCPADPAAWAGATQSVEIDGIRVTIAPGLSGANFAGRADVMRGEETQIFGAVALDPALAQGRHLLVLPGTHSKWVELIDGRVARFHTFMTGEMFALLRDHSTLGRAGADVAGRDEGFVDGLARAGTGLLASLFEARAAQLIEGRSHGWAMGLMSGLLIGGEFAEALALAGDAPDKITLIGDPALSDIYAQAAAAHGLATVRLDGDACVIAGLRRLAAHLTSTEAGSGEA
ncbi:2-dehydro-3-deoxygalactonokinase [Sphingomonas abietis]|uniref:2-dehydro-3-deoxygalactonokinase n=1 Tax=Sphingomonas abietis TaxID=3012344 RepID=A0ABY7NP40_9SPHN|nr:2-dehydro-3-deoxygalactonokinase [Sphingomonas abietis]WBO23305.1 2-dehydro-3-deoxygalactonokinase [Sphingomonas abietis]